MKKILAETLAILVCCSYLSACAEESHPSHALIANQQSNTGASSSYTTDGDIDDTLSPTPSTVDETYDATLVPSDALDNEEPPIFPPDYESNYEEQQTEPIKSELTLVPPKEGDFNPSKGG